MTICNLRRCHLLAPAASIVIGVASVNPSVATPINDVASVKGHTLYLEVTLNQLELHRIEPFILMDGRLYSASDNLLGLGLFWPGAKPGNGLVALDSLPGLQSNYDVANQTINLQAPIELLRNNVSRVGYKNPRVPQLDPNSREPGLLLNYDAYAQDYQDSHSISGWAEMRMFGLGPGVWRSSGIARSSNSKWFGNEFRSTRLDTSWQMDFPESMISVTLGDTLSGPLSWSRSMRFGGLRVARNFDLQPYRVTVPLALFAGETALPSVVDLYVNGIRESSNRVGPGPFEISGTPMITGAGSAQMVITDMTGQRRIVDVPLYNSSRLLQQGLSDWSFELGLLRNNYGIESFSYRSKPLTSGSLRYGLTNALTLESHFEHAYGLSMGGVGAALRLGEVGGILRSSVAASSQHQEKGYQYGVGYEWQGSKFNFSISTLRRDHSFRDVGTLDGSDLAIKSTQAFLGVNTSFGQFGTSFVDQSYRDGYRSKYAGLNWSRSLGKYGYLSLGANRDLKGDGGTQVFVYWSLPLGDNRQSWLSANHDRYGNSATAGVTQTLPGNDTGWGWRVQANRTPDSNSGLAEIRNQSRYGEWFAGGQYWDNKFGDNSSMAYAGATGALLLMKGELFPMQKVDDSFALVSTDGIADVPVKFENRPVGKTDKHGLLLISSLNAWQENDISVDPLGLPADIRVDYVRMQAIPPTGSGVLARFPMQEMLMVVLGVRDSSGEYIPAGTPVQLQTLTENKSLTVGYDGRMYLESPPSGGTLNVYLADGECSVELPNDLPSRGYIDIGELVCH